MTIRYRNTKWNTTMKYLILTGIIVSSVTVIYHIIAGVKFDQDCKGYLKRAADANSLEMADKELSKAIAYLNYSGLNTEEGRNRGRIPDHTSILYATPDEQLSFFYDNLITSQTEVREVLANKHATPTDRSNTLIKLRESLIDHGKEGDTVTYPSGLDVYPNNTLLVVLSILPLLFAGFCWLLMETE